MKDINLIRKVAWSFHKTTGLDWEDLFQEASLAYCKALKQYDPDRGVQLSTFMFWAIRSHLLNYIAKEKKHHNHIIPFEDLAEDYHTGTSLFEQISTEGQQLISVLFSSPVDFEQPMSTSFSMKIGKKMMGEGWERNKIWATLKELKNIFN